MRENKVKIRTVIAFNNKTDFNVVSETDCRPIDGRNLLQLTSRLIITETKYTHQVCRC